MGGKRFTPEEEAAIREWLLKGWSPERMAGKLHRSYTGVRQIISKIEQEQTSQITFEQAASVHNAPDNLMETAIECGIKAGLEIVKENENMRWKLEHLERTLFEEVALWDDGKTLLLNIKYLSQAARTVWPEHYVRELDRLRAQQMEESEDGHTT